MAISYTDTGFGWVNSQTGTAANSTGLKTLVPQIVDKRYHKQVRAKTFWARMGMIGADTYSEGSVMETASGVPVITKTDLQAQKGDTIKMGLLHSFTVAHTNGGKVGDAQLVDTESALDFSNCKVQIEHIRFGLRGNSGMNEQRNPYQSQEAIFSDSLQDGSADMVDTAILYAGACGFAPHLFRIIGTTNAPPTEPTLTYIGNDFTLTTTRTIADLVGAGDDNVKASTFEIGATAMEQNFFDPVNVGGEKLWVALISAKAALTLMQDTRFRDAFLYARERGKDNPLFKSVEFLYNNVMIYKYEKIRTILAGNNPAGLTVSSNAITEAAYTGIGGGVASTSLHQTLFFGANAIVFAEGRTQTNLVRAENDYNYIIGRANDHIFGARRARFVKEDTTTFTEQGMVKIINTLV